MASASQYPARRSPVNHWLITTLITAGTAFLGGIAGRLVWLAGLHRILAGSEPVDRPEILRAYAVSS